MIFYTDLSSSSEPSQRKFSSVPRPVTFFALNQSGVSFLEFIGITKIGLEMDFVVTSCQMAATTPILVSAEIYGKLLPRVPAHKFPDRRRLFMAPLRLD